MKRTQFLIVLALIVAAASFWQCGGDSPPAPDPRDEQLNKLSQTWKVTNVTKNNLPEPGYDNFEITMTGTPGQATFDFTTSGRPAGTKTPWPASGQFTFGTDFATVLTRNDNVTITYSVTSTQLQMTFTYTATDPEYTGRTNVIEGNWSFTFGL